MKQPPTLKVTANNGMVFLWRSDLVKPVAKLSDKEAKRLAHDMLMAQCDARAQLRDRGVDPDRESEA